jgi:DNA-binding PadR family transcriptional regulator
MLFIARLIVVCNIHYIGGVSITDAIVDGLAQELRRGTFVLGVLRLLKSPQYGYSLVTLLKERNLPIEAGTLYPLLRRLEEQGILASQWDVESAKPRKYYSLSPTGQAVYVQLCAHWQELRTNIDAVIGDKEGIHATDQ